MDELEIDGGLSCCNRLGASVTEPLSTPPQLLILTDGQACVCILVDELGESPELTALRCPLQDKCYQYWPDQGCWTYGNVRVVVEDFTVLVDYTIRKFCIQYVRLQHCMSSLRHSSTSRLQPASKNTEKKQIIMENKLLTRKPLMYTINKL